MPSTSLWRTCFVALVSLALIAGVCAQQPSIVYYRLDQPSRIVARTDAITMRTIPDSTAASKIVGMTVHESTSKLLWSDGNVVYRSNRDGTTREVFVGAQVRVTVQGYNLGASVDRLEIRVTTFRCETIVKWTPTSCTCIMRWPSSSTEIRPDDVSVQTQFGTATGITINAEQIMSTRAFTKPLLQAITIDSDAIGPHTIAVDNIRSGSVFLFVYDTLRGCIDRYHLNTYAVVRVASNLWDVRGLAVLGSTLWIALEKQGQVLRLDTASTSTPLPAIVLQIPLPRGLCVDPTNTTLYIAAKGGKIYKARTDGQPFRTRQGTTASYERLLGLSTSTRLNSIALDTTREFLYWTETNTNVVARAPLETLVRQVVVGGTPNSVLSWPRHVHVMTGGSTVVVSEYGGRIISGNPDSVSSFATVVSASTRWPWNDASSETTIHFYALD